MDRASLSSFVKSDRFVHVLTVIGFLIIAVFVFEAGIAVGFHKASYAREWEENYRTNFGDPSGRMGMPGAGLPDPHGADGTIVSVSLPTFVVAEGHDERSVRVGDDTLIRDGADSVDTSDLSVGKYVIILGVPGDKGEIDARLIRVMQAASSSVATTTSR